MATTSNAAMRKKTSFYVSIFLIHDTRQHCLIPAKAGIQRNEYRYLPRKRDNVAVLSASRGVPPYWIPTFAGMTGYWIIGVENGVESPRRFYAPRIWLKRGFSSVSTLEVRGAAQRPLHRRVGRLGDTGHLAPEYVH
jgi:hypothetical protein